MRLDGLVMVDFLGLVLVAVVSLGIWVVLRFVDVVEYELPARYRRRMRAAINAFRVPRQR